MSKTFMAGFFTCLLIFQNEAMALMQKTRHVVWDKTPVTIILPVGEERMIQFPLAISIVDSQLDNDMGIMKLQDALYLSAPAPFASKRLVVQLMPEGEVIVLNISAREDATDTTPVEIVMGESGLSEDSEESNGENRKAIRNDAALNPVVLTRFAIQSLYSPERLLVIPEGVSRTPMRTHKNIVMVYGASILARPVISWQGGDLFVTAVELKNMLKKEIAIDYKKLIGDWQTASFFPTNILEGRGGKDTTTVFVVSDRPFGEALSGTGEFVR